MAKTKFNEYWKRLVKERADKANGLCSGYLGRSWGEMDAEDLVNIIHILHAENRELRQRVARLDVDAFQQEIEKIKRA